MDSHPAPRTGTRRLSLAALLGLVALVAVLLAWKVVPKWRRAERAQAAIERKNLETLRKAMSGLEQKPNRSLEEDHLYQKSRRVLTEHEAKGNPH